MSCVRRDNIHTTAVFQTLYVYKAEMVRGQGLINLLINVILLGFSGSFGHVMSDGAILPAPDPARPPERRGHSICVFDSPYLTSKPCTCIKIQRSNGKESVGTDRVTSVNTWCKDCLMSMLSMPLFEAVGTDTHHGTPSCSLKCVSSTGWTIGLWLDCAQANRLYQASVHMRFTRAVYFEFLEKMIGVSCFLVPAPWSHFRSKNYRRLKGSVLTSNRKLAGR
jgi:hypothetical protein